MSKTTTNINAEATQLALDLQYYQSKAQECWELLEQIDGLTAKSGSLSFAVSVNGHATHLPVPLTDIEPINNIFMTLVALYRSKYIVAKRRYDQLKAPSPY